MSDHAKCFESRDTHGYLRLKAIQTATGERIRLDTGDCKCQANSRAPAGRNRTTSGRPKRLISVTTYNTVNHGVQ
jgi:hypothetical protein